MNKQTLMLCGSVVLLLTACGGGGSDPAPVAPAATEAVPDTASKSSAGLVTYITALSTSAADDKDPLALSKFTPVEPEDTEPEPLS